MARQRVEPAPAACAFCGRPLPARTGPGRPRRFCSDAHKEAVKLGLRYVSDDEMAWLNGRRRGRPLQDPEIAAWNGRRPRREERDAD